MSWKMDGVESATDSSGPTLNSHRLEVGSFGNFLRGSLRQTEVHEKRLTSVDFCGMDSPSAPRTALRRAADSGSFRRRSTESTQKFCRTEPPSVCGSPGWARADWVMTKMRPALLDNQLTQGLVAQKGSELYLHGPFTFLTQLSARGTFLTWSRTWFCQTFFFRPVVLWQKFHEHIAQ